MELCLPSSRLQWSADGKVTLQRDGDQCPYADRHRDGWKEEEITKYYTLKYYLSNEFFIKFKSPKKWDTCIVNIKNKRSKIVVEYYLSRYYHIFTL